MAVSQVATEDKEAQQWSAGFRGDMASALSVCAVQRRKYGSRHDNPCGRKHNDWLIRSRRRWLRAAASKPTGLHA